MTAFSPYHAQALTVELPALRMSAGVHSPHIGANLHWYEWYAEQAAFADTGICAKGERGERGARGEQGVQGVQGIQGAPGAQGERGINGVAVAQDGTYAFDVDAQGHLLLHGTGENLPGFFVQDGHLYLDFSTTEPVEVMDWLPGPQGEPGRDGRDGVDGTNGADGYTPVRGVDYWTQADQAAIVAAAVAALPDASEVVY